MDSNEFEKNKLDLIYQKNLQKLNAVLAYGTVGAITVIAAYIANPLAVRQTIIIALFIVLSALALYIKVSGQLDKIIDKIDKLK